MLTPTPPNVTEAEEVMTVFVVDVQYRDRFSLHLQDSTLCFIFLPPLSPHES